MAEEKHILLAELGDWQALPEEQMRQGAEAFLAALRRRHSIRAFASEPVPQDIIESCIAAAGTAPSGANHQPWHFALVGDAAIKAQIRAAAEEEERAFYDGRAGAEWLDALAPIGTDATKEHLTDAPWLICIFAQRRGGVETGDAKKNYYIHESVGIATGMLITGLHMAGLATLTHTPNPMSFLNKFLKRPDTEKPYLILVVGKPADGATVPAHALKKKPLKDILSVF
ncbi:oxidoreductase [Aquisalinus flavus]|uniref:Oxidoreductase n=1 Tax=Aquisalinus flavus TaxID=1526572 RepID=A0A8J2V6I7_9PROT|nr:nitroreductase family protein [Aquisalinus flavus]MBD0428085.1 nitroreductase family protein [Aquisalinus flavus]GGD18774.1 oxidoreductase [Aquisalinus flavus]